MGNSLGGKGRESADKSGDFFKVLSEKHQNSNPKRAIDVVMDHFVAIYCSIGDLSSRKIVLPLCQSQAKIL